MVAKKLRIPFAIDASGEPVNIKDAANGLACACCCPCCGAQVVAKQGKDKGRVWHFSHHNAEECTGGYESAMHLAVKKIIETERALFLPDCGVLRHPQVFDSPVQYRTMFSAPSREKPTCFDVWEYSIKQTAEKLIRDHHGMDRFGFTDIPARRIEFDSVIAEKNEGDIRPDLIGMIGDRKLYIEVAVTHFIDEEKLTKIRSRGVSTVEIVIPEMDSMDWEKLREIVLTDSGNTFWRFNPKAEQMAEDSHQARLKDVEEKREIAQHKADAKKRVYEERFKPTHEVSLKRSRNGFGSRIFVRLCPANLNMSVYPFDSGLADITKRVARQFAGKYNTDYYKWEFLPNEDLFFQVIKTLRSQAEELEFSGWKYMDDPENENFLRKIGLKIWRKGKQATNL